MTISYRKLTVAETKAYRSLRLEALKRHPQSFGSTYEEQRTLPKLRFETVLEEELENYFMMGAFDDQKLIGICGFVPFSLKDDERDETTGTIIQVYVKGAYSGQKVGAGLMQATVAAAFTQPKIEEVILEVRRVNMPAIRTYERAGFVVVSQDERDQLMVVRKGN